MTKIILSYTGSPKVKISQKVLGVTFFDSHYIFGKEVPIKFKTSSVSQSGSSWIASPHCLPFTSHAPLLSWPATV